MKIRSGFVSNSSSSSFCILGVEIDQETYDKLEREWKNLRESRVRTASAISGGDDLYVGISATSMKDDETPRHLKQELVDVLHEIGVDIQLENVDWHEDGGYNG
jgi:uncharacterized UPF0160 family protein